VRLFIIIFILAISIGFSQFASSQISAPTSNGQFPANYIPGINKDTIYYFCSPTSASNVGQLVVNGPNPSSTYTFIWQKFNPVLQQFITFNVAVNVTSSTQPGLLSGGYKVIIEDNLGNKVDCHVAWVYVVDINLTMANMGTGCSPLNPPGASYSGPNVINFTYYHPPPDPVIIDSNTIFELCIKGNIPYISDMGIVLEAPGTCGNKRVTVVPFAAASDVSISPFCNPGAGVDACFRSDLPVNFDICTQPVAMLTGTHGFGPVDPFNGFNYPINDIYHLNGCNAAQSNWEVIMLDYAPPDNPTVQEIILKIINPGVVTCDGQGDTITQIVTGINTPIAEGAPNGGWDPNTATKIPLNFSNAVPNAPIVYNYDSLLNVHISNNPTAIQWTTNNGVTFIDPNVLNPVPTNAITQDTWFYFTLSDHLGCTFTDSVFFEYISPQIDSTQIDQITCYSDSNGAIISFDTWGHEYSIDLGATWQFSNSFLNLGPGIYSVIIKDVSGTCLDTINATIIEPDSLEVQVSPTNSNCYDACDGNAVAGTLGGTSPYTYSWSHDPSNGNFITGVCPDSNYFVVVTDSNNCTASDTFHLSSPTPFSFTLVIDTSSCSIDDGSICINNLSGASPPYGYSWDLNSGGGSDSCATGLASGLYSVTVFDDRACDSSMIINVPTYPQPLANVVPLSDTNACLGANVNFSSNGTNGTPPYNYVWSEGWTGPGPHSYTVNDTSCITVKIQDGNGCESNLTTICINPHPPIVGTISGGPQVCENGTIDLLASGVGGISGTYNYLWSDNLGNSNMVTIGADSLYPSNKEYSVVISDGCSANDTVYTSISVLRPPIALFELSDSLDCYPQDVEFIDKSDNSLTGVWDLGTTAQPYQPGQKLSYYYPNPGSYEVTLVTSSPDACTDTFSMELCIKVSDRFFIPDVFSPNGNGFNDVFRIYAKNYDQAKLVIYDRWGEKIFESLTLEIGWDGTFRGLDMPSGIYVYFLDVLFDDGATMSEKGNLTLIR
jgi:gliding motility-associated-like protein